LIEDHGLNVEDILILEAQDYIGGRVKQTIDFVQGVKIDLGDNYLSVYLVF
jgi:monoamine oxidase